MIYSLYMSFLKPLGLNQIGGVYVFQNDPKQMVSLKIMILYVVKALGHEVRKTDLTDFFMFYDYMNFFEFQQYLTELIETGLIVEIADPAGNRFLITDTGLKSIGFFSDRLDKSTKRELEWRLEIEQSKKLVESKADGKYVKDSDGVHYAELRIMTGSRIDFYMKLKVESRESAEALISRWYDKSESMANEINAWRSIMT